MPKKKNQSAANRAILRNHIMFVNQYTNDDRKRILQNFDEIFEHYVALHPDGETRQRGFAEELKQGHFTEKFSLLSDTKEEIWRQLTGVDWDRSNPGAEISLTDYLENRSLAGKLR